MGDVAPLFSLKFALAQTQDKGMKRSRFGGTDHRDIEEHEVSDASIYKWKAKFGGMDVTGVVPLRGAFRFDFNANPSAQKPPNRGVRVGIRVMKVDGADHRRQLS
jgi:hypothetical protein